MPSTIPPSDHWTLQGAHGVYTFADPGRALASLVEDLSEPGTLYSPSGFAVAGVSIQGRYSANQAFAIVLQYAPVDEEYACVVSLDGEVSGAPLGRAPLHAYLQHGWVAV